MTWNQDSSNNEQRRCRRQKIRACALLGALLAAVLHKGMRSAAWTPGPALRSVARPQHDIVSRCRVKASKQSSSTFADKKEALKQCLAREYTSFFRPFEQDFYTPGVKFKDPLNELAGVDMYRANVEMLSGESLTGKFLINDGYINLHSVEDVPDDEFRLRTRWTLGFKFVLLPWRPEALFSGVSEYTIDADAKVVSQRDYWDTINLEKGGGYSPEDEFAGLLDLGAQLFLPKADKPEGWELLRRTYEYEVYREGKSGPIFAVSPPQKQLEQRAIAAAVERHGLVSGAPEERSGYATVQVVPPHPWEDSPFER